MKKLLLFFVAALACCAPLTPIAIDLGDFTASFDEGVSCADFPKQADDISAVAAPGVLFLNVNQNHRPGVFIDAIASTEREWVDNSTYTFSGDWRKVSGDIEQIDVNLQLIKDYTEQRAEVIWTLNPESPLYEWVWTRAQSDEPIKLFKLKSDNEFHRFSITAEYRKGMATVKRISVDNQTAQLNFPAGTLSKDWEGSFMLLLETTNKYTACSPLNAFSGVSQWRSITLNREAILNPQSMQGN